VARAAREARLHRPSQDAVPARIARALRFDVDTDVVAFETALRERRLADALLLRHGELPVRYDDAASEAWTSWLGFERGRWRVAWRDAALERLEGALDPAEGVAR
jgi:hypothetical protein